MKPYRTDKVRAWVFAALTPNVGSRERVRPVDLVRSLWPELDDTSTVQMTVSGGVMVAIFTSAFGFIYAVYRIGRSTAPLMTQAQAISMFFVFGAIYVGIRRCSYAASLVGLGFSLLCTNIAEIPAGF